MLRTCPGYQTAPLVASLSEARAMRQQNRWLRVQECVASLSEARAMRQQDRWLRVQQWWGKDYSALKRLAFGPLPAATFSHFARVEP
ncbi:hypothetical protein MAKP2_07310 [Klebsiella pneumoniae subsp. pneumoniae]|nr:hypothetical protein MAKP2_07310 [Klebsiella pneumoniae subsp. pneumoniae]